MSSFFAPGTSLHIVPWLKGFTPYTCLELFSAFPLVFEMSPNCVLSGWPCKLGLHGRHFSPPHYSPWSTTQQSPLRSQPHQQIWEPALHTAPFGCRSFHKFFSHIEVTVICCFLTFDILCHGWKIPAENYGDP